MGRLCSSLYVSTGGVTHLQFWGQNCRWVTPPVLTYKLGQKSTHLQFWGQNRRWVTTPESWQGPGCDRFIIDLPNCAFVAFTSLSRSVSRVCLSKLNVWFAGTNVWFAGTMLVCNYETRGSTRAWRRPGSHTQGWKTIKKKYIIYGFLLFFLCFFYVFLYVFYMFFFCFFYVFF